MNDERLETLIPLQRQLLLAAREWSRGEELPPDVDEIRHEAIRINHLRYGELVPYYQHVARDQGLLGPLEVDEIVQNLMFPGLFKTYEPRWLAVGDFTSMTDWLSNVSTLRPGIDPAGLRDLNQWRQRLRSAGIFLSYSSGTSGRMSIVPRDTLSFQALCTNSSAYARQCSRICSRESVRLSIFFEERRFSTACSMGRPWQSQPGMKSVWRPVMFRNFTTMSFNTLLSA